MILVDGAEMLDVREAAQLVGRNPETVRRWVWTGKLAAIKHGNRMLIRKADLPSVTGDRSTDGKPALASWAGRVHDTIRDGRAGSTARDLVLEDRAWRDDSRDHAGR